MGREGRTLAGPLKYTGHLLAGLKDWRGCHFSGGCGDKLLVYSFWDVADGSAGFGASMHRSVASGVSGAVVNP